jgi:hypothetical protein
MLVFQSLMVGDRMDAVQSTMVRLMGSVRAGSGNLHRTISGVSA